MTILLYIVGLIIGITLFLYVLSTYESGKEKYKEYMKTKLGPDPVKSQISSNDITYTDPTPQISKKRTCPLCGTTLKDFEALFATEGEEEGRRKILIHGCRYCYKESKNENTEE